MIKIILLVFLTVWGFQLFALPQTTPTVSSQAEDKWWVEAKARGQKVAQLKQARYDANTAVNDRLHEGIIKSNGTIRKDVYDKLQQQAAAELAAIQQRYDPQIAEAQQQYGALLQERTPSDSSIYAATESMRPLLLYKEKAKYTEAARQNRVEGIVGVSMVFRADGTISNQRIVQGLTDGLSDEAIKATREIVFLPAVKNGKPISVRVMIEYNFNLI